jgi:hypothetical protein
MKSFLVALLMGATSVMSGCGVYMAFTQPPPVDVAAIEQEGPGLPREFLIQRLGTPKGTTVNDDGSKIDIYEFYEGSSSSWSVGRGAFHIAADFFSIGLWEIVATPMEWAIRGDKLTARAEFDKNNRLTSFRILGREIKPLEKIHREQMKSES